MRVSLAGLFMVCSGLWIAGCSSQPVAPERSARMGLEPWVESELAPYLADQLSHHPRFRGQSLLIVRLEGPDVQPDIDGLTRHIREQIREALLDTPGATLPWRPSRREQRHHRRLARADCRNLRDANYFVGIETSRTLSGQHRVSVRALDVKAREWVTGFGKTWQGHLTPIERAAMQQSEPDEALRGLRVLPFGPDQLDLAADYLANNLSCLLQHRDQDELVIQVQPAPAGPPFLSRLLGMIGTNLSRYREVRVSDREADANFVLRGQAHELQPGLYQVWMLLNPEGSGRHLEGMDTAVYLLARDGQRVARNGASMRSEPRGRRLDPGPYRRSGYGLGIAGEDQRVTLSGVSMSREPRLRRLDLVPHPEAGYSLELAVEDADRVFLVANSRREGLTRLYPDGCVGMEPAGDGVYRVDELPISGEATVYAIAARDGVPAQRLARHLELLPDNCSAGSRSVLSGRRLEPWLDRLDRLMDEYRGRLVWSAQRTP